MASKGGQIPFQSLLTQLEDATKVVPEIRSPKGDCRLKADAQYLNSPTPEQLFVIQTTATTRRQMS